VNFLPSPLSRRRFLQALAAIAPMPFLTSRSFAQPTASPVAATPPPGKDFSAFPLTVVGAADDQAVRKSEASMITLHDNTVLLAYATHSGRSDNDPAPIVTRLLSPDGVPVTPERVTVQPPPGGMNSMSPALRRLPDGRIGMLFSYRMSVHDASRRFIASSDEGRTWSDAVVVASGGYKTGCHDRFTVHSSGRLLAPCHCTADWNGHHLHVEVARSDDLGKTWQMSAAIELPTVRWMIPHAPGIESGCIEPCIVERPDGSLLMTMRTAMGTQFKSESDDRGETWSPPRSLEVISPLAPAHLSRLPGGDRLLLLWTPDFKADVNLMGERHTIMSCVSDDGGRSWPLERRKVLVHLPTQNVDYPCLLYRGNEAWIGLRVSTGVGILQGHTSTCLIRTPLSWFASA